MYGRDFPGGSEVNNFPTSAGNGGAICGFNQWVGRIPWRRKWQLVPSILAWEIPWTEEPAGLQSVGLGSKESDTT